MITADARPRLATALTIAGSDSSGGAGIQADLKTFHRFGVYGQSVISLITAQNTTGVTAIELLTPAMLSAQFDAVMTDIGCDAAKTGALGSVALIEAAVDGLRRHAVATLVVDPVTVSKHGHALLAADAAAAFARLLLPLATVVTPNWHEAAMLTGRSVRSTGEALEAARHLTDHGARAVIVKAGAGSGADADDVLLIDDQHLLLPGLRVATRHTHGTGCTFSAAITALLAKGLDLPTAALQAKAFISHAIVTAPGLGSGHGPVNHWA